VIAKIQAQRAMHAKEVFLKELSALGKRMKKQDWAKDETSRIKNKRDPIKLRLEQISLADIDTKSNSASDTAKISST
jgi:hypothetical protein